MPQYKLSGRLALVFTFILLAACGRDDTDGSLNPPSTAPAVTLHEQFSSWLLEYPQPSDESQMWMDRIHLKEALEKVEAGLQSEPIVAVLDSGVDYEHPALRHRIVDTSGYSTHCRNQHHGCNTSSYQYGQKDLGDGAVFPLGTSQAGQSCRTVTSELTSQCAHGTHVSGIIAGFYPNSQVFGICPNCRILPVRIVNDAGQITDDAIYAALEYIAELLRAGMPIRIINASFGKYQRSERVNKAITLLTETAGDVLIVSASGNENSWLDSFPAAHPNVISVANVNSSNLQKDGRSNYGPAVDIAAPVGDCDSADNGYGIVSSIPGQNGDSQCLNGTSMAAPMVAGVAGLLLTVEPGLSAAQVKSRIMASADRNALYTANPSYLLSKHGKTYPMLGAGLLRADQALQQNIQTPEEKKRVDANCGVVGGSHGSGGGLWFYLIPLLLAFGVRSLSLRRERTI